MKYNRRITAYIDGVNLHKTTAFHGWLVEYGKFYIFLTEKYKVSEIIIFLGRIEKSSHLYTRLVTLGYKIVFKETLVEKTTGKVKGNCDAELVLNPKIPLGLPSGFPLRKV